MRVKTEMIALQQTSTTTQNNFVEQQHSGILSEKSAILLCGVGVAMFAIPVLVVIQVISGLYWGGVSVYELLNGAGLDKINEI
jgi:hypothetical protein